MYPKKDECNVFLRMTFAHLERLFLVPTQETGMAYVNLLENAADMYLFLFSCLLYLPPLSKCKSQKISHTHYFYYLLHFSFRGTPGSLIDMVVAHMRSLFFYSDIALLQLTGDIQRMKLSNTKGYDLATVTAKTLIICLL